MTLKENQLPNPAPSGIISRLRSIHLFTRDSLGIWYLAMIVFLCAAFSLRVSLMIGNFSRIAGNWPALVPSLAVGAVLDLFTALWLLLPFSLFLLLLPDRYLGSKIWRTTIGITWFGFIFMLIYLGVVEYFFFREYDCRFNCIAVDYLVFPKEICIEIWDGYPVCQVITLDAVIAFLVIFKLRRKIFAGLSTPAPRRTRRWLMAVQAALLVIGLLTIGPGMARVSDNRVVNEMTLDGLYSFADAVWTNRMDYDRNYARMDDTAAFAHVRTLLASDNSAFLPEPDSLSITRRIAAPGQPRRMNVVIILEESFGAQFVTSLQSDGPGGTPEFEKLADSGLLFTNIYATGTRTVRGMEAVLLSLPPVPGQSVVRQPEGYGVFSLPSLLKSEGYQTAFVYGGYSYFDNMKDFTLSNGFDRVFDRGNLTQQTFATVWGMCDEDLFDNSLSLMDSLQAGGKPFFTFILTVSNHSPFAIPPGRIDAVPSDHSRRATVRYMDHALGRFIRQARNHPFFDSTLFVVLGDHGPKVFGSPRVPMRSYHIPLLIYAPSVLAHGQRVATLGSQIDLAPTIMGLLNISYVSQFFGKDLLRTPQDSGAALLSLNRDIALCQGSSLAVLGLHQSLDLWKRDPANDSLARIPVGRDLATLENAIAYYQTAEYLLSHHKLHPLKVASDSSR